MSEPGTLREAVANDPEARQIAEHLAQAGVVNLDADLRGAIESAKQKGISQALPANNQIFNTIVNMKKPHH
ncbi:Uncharacterised protein [Mycobacteroides abscessus subsp. massiliense]|uniref:hypothetical protein n=1 Tax=Mycobacteroides abscessus TaxID=36809 RepID=UPI00031CFC6B|nr:hypothetical protein [Mycobacteroides abscessus]MBN7316331.1 hypothetical protein [Mycobacteroides abscessus subsp. massiliense]MBN7323875.1 hypothetical protein [Mycobacteroides abscessus subsp. massiliense]MDO3031651.1 hypothetical protein [Mycobacteroides abscessus subsp. massiliense]SKE06877.1 Uncharacterised protein [Mycobacteroides abscessus subsp. massiliense]SKE52685.1 Uncharacterised protein [Mycobacteroides abscessus subsp. massiliense]